MSEMIERVAKAIKANLAADDGSVYFRDDGGTCMVDGNVNVTALARAAIEAMRPPTDEMKAAASRIPHARDEEIFTAMIDAALAETPG